MSKRLERYKRRGIAIILLSAFLTLGLTGCGVKDMSARIVKTIFREQKDALRTEIFFEIQKKHLAGNNTETDAVEAVLGGSVVKAVAENTATEVTAIEEVKAEEIKAEASTIEAMTEDDKRTMNYLLRQAMRKTKALHDDVCARCVGETTTYEVIWKYANRLHNANKSEPHHYSEFCEDCFCVQYEVRHFWCNDCGDNWTLTAEVGWIFECKRADY